MTSPTVPVFINEQPINASAGATLADVLAAHDPALATALAAGEATATDARALPVAGDTVVTAGAIFRVARSARTASPSDD